MTDISTLTRENFTLFFGGDKTNSPLTEPFVGLPVTITATGQIVGYGHLSTAEFLPAAIHLYITEADAQCDEAGLIALEENVLHGWAVLSSYTNAEEWEITTLDVRPETINAFPVTVLEA